jgi:O-antigen/teichoic acid export membrane protein
MRKIISNIKENRYLFQIITLISGTLFAQIISFASIPILTRLYTPSEFGLYSLFFAITSMVAMVSSLSYEQSIVLPKSRKDAKAIFILSIIITFIFSIMSLVILLIFKSYIKNYFAQEQYLIYLIPISILILGLTQIFDAYSTREELYREIAFSKVTTATTASITQITSKGLFNIDGLVFGKVLGDLFGSFVLFFNLKSRVSLRDVSRDDIIFNLRHYSSFPKYQMPSNLINSISQNIPIFMLSALFSPAIAGFYSLTYRAMQTPILLISGATRSVFYQKASKIYAKGEDIYPLYISTTLGLIKLFIVPFIIILLFGQEIFIFVFGREWQEAGLIAQISIIWFYFGFISPPTTMVFNILNLQHIRLYIQIITLILRAIAIYLGFLIFKSYIIAIALFIAVGVIHNGFNMVYIYYKLKKNRKN